MAEHVPPFIRSLSLPVRYSPVCVDNVGRNHESTVASRLRRSTLTAAPPPQGFRRPLLLNGTRLETQARRAARRLPAAPCPRRIRDLLRGRYVPNLFARFAQTDFERLVQDREDCFALFGRRRFVASLLKCFEQRLQQPERPRNDFLRYLDVRPRKLVVAVLDVASFLGGPVLSRLRDCRVPDA